MTLDKEQVLKTASRIYHPVFIAAIKDAGK
jgi:hypothetical protein